MQDNLNLGWRVQAAVYAFETVVLLGLLTLAARGSQDFLLGPWVRLLAAALMPLPCHLLVAWAVLRNRRWEIRRLPLPALVPQRPAAVPAWQPVPVAPALATARQPS